MPITYTRDDASRRIEVRASGSFNADEIVEIIHRQQREGTWHYALLFDGRLLHGTITFEELQRIRAVDAQDSAPRGPIAIVHTDPTLYRKACAYAMLVATKRRVEVFEDRDEAERWLREQGF